MLELITVSDEADWEMTCVGHWDEDWNSYMITFDPEDPTSTFRCWVSVIYTQKTQPLAKAYRFLLF